MSAESSSTKLSNPPEGSRSAEKRQEPLPTSVAELHRIILAQRKTIHVLTREMAKKQSEQGSTLERLRQTRVLEDVVLRKTVELNRERNKLGVRNRDMRLLLDHVAEGFLTVDGRGVVSTERSAAIDRWLGEAPQGATLWSLFGRVDAQLGLQIELVWQLVVDDVLPREVALAQLPRTILIQSTELRIDYRQIQAEGDDLRLLVVLTDITLEKDKLRTEEREREILRAFEHVVRDRQGFFEFLDEADSLVQKLDPGRERVTPKAARVSILVAPTPGRRPTAHTSIVPPISLEEEQRLALHTLKGNCALFGFGSVAIVCHEAEEGWIEGSSKASESLKRVREAWDRATATFRDLRRDRDREGEIEVSRRELDELIRAVEAGVARFEIAHRIRVLRMERLGKRLERLADTARGVAARLGKSVEVHIDDGLILLDGRVWSTLFLAMAHLVRNAVDHGIERPEERLARGKPATGRLEIRGRLVQNDFELEVTDDGRGVDWERVLRRASALDLPHATITDLRLALLSPGFSTQETVTDLSGRGVGLSAVAREVTARGGTIEIAEGPIHGTRFVLRLAAHAMMRARADVAPPTRPEHDLILDLTQSLLGGPSKPRGAKRHSANRGRR